MHNNEEFIVSVPELKTMTLLDPDDQLLIDTDTDGVYEAGVTEFSGYEIHFMLNSASLARGAGTFSFSANSVDELLRLTVQGLAETLNAEHASIRLGVVPDISPLDDVSDGETAI